MKIIIATLTLFILPILILSQTQYEMNKDAYNEYKKTDKELNKVYKEIIELYKDDTLFIKKLRIAQRIWIKLRDADLEMQYPHMNDTIDVMYYYG